MEGYFFTDRFVFRLVRADVMFGKCANEIEYRMAIVSDGEDYDVFPISPDILKHMMVRVNKIWNAGKLTNATFDGMDYHFEIRRTSTKEVVATGYAKEQYDLSPLHWFAANVKPGFATTLWYD